MKVIHLIVADCKQKWTNMRNSYARHLRNKNKASGSEIDNSPNWYLSEVMSFLKDHMKHRRPKRYNDKDEENLSNDTEETENLHENENIGNLNQHAKKRPVLETVQRYHPSKKFLSSQHLIAPMLNFLKSNTRSKNEQENPFLIFCKGLLPDYEQLTSKRQRLFKEKMMFFINSLLDEQESESSINNFCAPTIAHNGTISGRYTFIHFHANNISPLSKNDLTEEPEKNSLMN